MGARGDDIEAVLQTSLEELWAPPPDDTGAATAARYRFQSEVIARDAISCLLTGRGAVVCEWQQDAIVIHGKDDVELLSVKHIEASQGRWTRRQLIDAGGLRQLFERWQSNYNNGWTKFNIHGPTVTGGDYRALVCHEFGHVLGMMDMVFSGHAATKATCVGATHTAPQIDDQQSLTKMYSTALASS